MYDILAETKEKKEKKKKKKRSYKENSTMIFFHSYNRAKFFQSNHWTSRFLRRLLCQSVRVERRKRKKEKKEKKKNSARYRDARKRLFAHLFSHLTRIRVSFVDVVMCVCVRVCARESGEASLSPSSAVIVPSFLLLGELLIVMSRHSTARCKRQKRRRKKKKAKFDCLRFCVQSPEVSEVQRKQLCS